MHKKHNLISQNTVFAENFHGEEVASPCNIGIRFLEFTPRYAVPFFPFCEITKVIQYVEYPEYGNLLAEMLMNKLNCFLSRLYPVRLNLP